MAAIQPEAVRTAVEGRVGAQVTTLDRASTEPFEFVRVPTHSPVHTEYAVGCPVSNIVDGLQGDRQKTGEGCFTLTEIRVGFWWQVTKERVAGVAAARAVETSVRNALVATGWTTDFHVLWMRRETSTGNDGWLWLEQTFNAYHLMPLS